MSRLELFTIGFGRPDLLIEQKRLLDAHLQDEFGLCLLDNTKNRAGREDMEHACAISGVGYMAVSSEAHEHVDGLNLAAKIAIDINADYWGILDHDVFPAQSTFLVHRIKQAGFYGMGNGLPDGSVKWLWPGFCFFSREWLNGRIPDFTGVKGGDAGSGLHVLFTAEDWKNLPTFEHGYEEIRPNGGPMTQSSCIEKLGDWVHFQNASNWMLVPFPLERDQLLRNVLKKL